MKIPSKAIDGGLRVGRPARGWCGKVGLCGLGRCEMDRCGAELIGCAAVQIGLVRGAGLGGEVHLLV